MPLRTTVQVGSDQRSQSGHALPRATRGSRKAPACPAPERHRPWARRRSAPLQWAVGRIHGRHAPRSIGRGWDSLALCVQERVYPRDASSRHIAACGLLTPLRSAKSGHLACGVEMLVLILKQERRATTTAVLLVPSSTVDRAAGHHRGLPTSAGCAPRLTHWGSSWAGIRPNGTRREAAPGRTRALGRSGPGTRDRSGRREHRPGGSGSLAGARQST